MIVPYSFIQVSIRIKQPKYISLFPSIELFQMHNQSVKPSQVLLSPFISLHSLLSNLNTHKAPCTLEYSESNLSTSQHSISSSSRISFARRASTHKFLKNSTSKINVSPQDFKKTPSSTKECIPSCKEVPEYMKNIRTRCLTAHVVSKTKPLDPINQLKRHESVQKRVKLTGDSMERKVKKFKMCDKKTIKEACMENGKNYFDQPNELQGRLLKIKSMGIEHDERKSKVYLKKLIQNRHFVVHFADQAHLPLWKKVRNGIAANN